MFLRMGGSTSRIRREKHMADMQTTQQRGVFITIEGGDGAGKTTQASLLVERLQQMGCTVRHVHEPGGTELGERIREILLDNGTGEIDPLAELLLYEAARAQIVSKVVAPALERGEVVVCDRFVDSTVAYQGYGRELDVRMVEKLNGIASHGVVPDRTVLLLMDPERGLARATAGDEGGDRMEQAGRAFHQRVCSGFAILAESCAQRVRVVDASGSPADVHCAVFEQLADLFEGVRVSEDRA